MDVPEGNLYMELCHIYSIHLHYTRIPTRILYIIDHITLGNNYHSRWIVMLMVFYFLRCLLHWMFSWGLLVMILKLIDSLEDLSFSYIRRDIRRMFLSEILRYSCNRFKCFMICESWFYRPHENINSSLCLRSCMCSEWFLLCNLLFRYNYLCFMEWTNRKYWFTSSLMCFNSIECYSNLFERSIKCYCYVHIILT